MKTKEEYIDFMIQHGCNTSMWSYQTNNLFEREFKDNGNELKQWKKELNNLLSKRYRIIQKLKTFKNKYFITLTIDNENQKKQKQTFERKIKEIFKGTNYIANEDYGKTNTKRLHYHVVCEEDIDITKWKYGFTSKFKCRFEDKDNKQIARYITKLANHTLKEKGAKIIYGRRKRTKESQNKKTDKNN